MTDTSSEASFKVNLDMMLQSDIIVEGSGDTSAIALGIVIC